MLRRALLASLFAGATGLQASAPNSTLPNFFNLPSCSKHGSHPTPFNQALPRIQAGMFQFGPQDVTVFEFQPLSSQYLEPIIMIAMPGFVLALLLLLSCVCFCYRRYRLGRCGEPIPTVTAYTPREIFVTRGVAAASFGVSLVCSALACLVANASYQGGLTDIITAGYATEEIINASFRVGDELLLTSLGVNTELDAFASLVATYVDAAMLSADLECANGLLAMLPDGAQMLETATALGAATATVPSIGVTDSLFADLRRPQQLYPVLVPPLTDSLSTLQQRVGGLPHLPTLSRRLAKVNTSIVNTTGLPTQIVRALVGVNASLASLPNLTLLEERLYKVSHEQTEDASHICSNIPIGWQPGDETECDELRAQLRQTRDALAATDAELPLDLFARYEALAADFPPLDAVHAALILERNELADCPNLTKTELEYGVLETTITGWDPTAIEWAINAVASAGASLDATNPTRLVPELQIVDDSQTPLLCVQSILSRLTLINTSLLTLPPNTESFFGRALALDTSLRAIPAPPAFIASLQALSTALLALPGLPAYTAGVGGISVALGAMPPSATLMSALHRLNEELPLASTHEGIVNISAALHGAMINLPSIAPFRTSLQLINASRAELPPLIERALHAIEQYDALGDTSDLGVVEEALVGVRALNGRYVARPDDDGLRAGFAAIEVEFGRMPPTDPTVAQVDALDGALQRLPDVSIYMSGLAALLASVAATPSVDVLRDTWNELKARLASVPAFSVTQAPLEQYAGVEAAMPTPPTALLDGTRQLHGLLAAVPTLVESGKTAITSTHDATQGAVATLRLALFGEVPGGYTARLEGMQPAITLTWWAFLTSSFGLPVAISCVTVVACLTRTGRPALYAGHALMSILPFYTLLGGSVELPMTVMLKDACDNVPFLTDRLMAHLVTLEMPQFNLLAAPLVGWVTGCPETDPMATFYTPMVDAANSSTLDATRDLAALQLRPAIRQQVARLVNEAGEVARTADGVHGMLACSRIHERYIEVHTAICCDVAYAFTATWMVRLVTTAVLVASLIASVAGYKRFRRKKDLWGPYASIEALEVGSYL